jgi:hypothetical protein
MASKMGSAQDRLERILAMRGPKLMCAEATRMARKGEVDEALILLIEANIQQAQQADAPKAVEVLRLMLKAIKNERERQLPDEQKLLRKLLQLDQPEERKGLLYTAFKPTKTANAEGELRELPPLITPPAFINLVRGFIESFGNVDSMNIMGRAQSIIDEAQIVATDLYGEGELASALLLFVFVD